MIIALFLVIINLITSLSFSMTVQQAQEFKNSLDTYEVGTVRKALSHRDGSTISIEASTGNIIVNSNDNSFEYLLVRNSKEELVDTYIHKINECILSPCQTKLLAVEIALNKELHRWQQEGVWVLDLEKKGTPEYRSFKKLALDSSPRFFAISDLKKIAFAHDNFVTVHQCAYPEENLAEQKIYGVVRDLNKYPRQLSSVKFNASGSYIGEKYYLPHMSEGNSDWVNPVAIYSITELPHRRLFYTRS